MGLVGIAAVTSAIVTKLKADMPAKVAALNTEYDDAYTLTAPAAESYFDHAVDPFSLTCEWPAVVLLDDGDAEDPEQSNFELHVIAYRVIVDVIVRGQDATEMTAKLRRYKRAAIEILTARHALAPTCTNCTYERGSGAELTDPSSGDLLQDKACRFIITTAEAAS